jgi:RNA polymerase sigma-70 factor (family 1)
MISSTSDYPLVGKNESVLSDLVGKLRDGNADAFHEVYKLFGSRVYRLGKKFYLSHEDAEEVVQEVFVILWEKRQNLDLEKDFTSYLLKIAKSIIIKNFKRKVLFAAYENYVANFTSRANMDTENMIHYNNIVENLQVQIRQLPKVKKEIMVLSRVEYLSNEEIAEKMGLSRRTVENHIYRSLKTLKKKLEITAY